MEDSCISERELNFPPRNIERTYKLFWGRFTALVQTMINDDSLAERYPLNYPDELILIGSDEKSIKLAFQAELSLIE